MNCKKCSQQHAVLCCACVDAWLLANLAQDDCFCPACAHCDWQHLHVTLLVLAALCHHSNSYRVWPSLRARLVLQ